MTAPALLSVEGLTVRFHTQRGSVTAIEDVSFELRPGEVLGLVGESGSGKSVTALSLLRLIPDNVAEIAAGHVWFGGRDLAHLSERELRHVRGREIGMIFQEPMTSLNPIASIGWQLQEPLWLHLRLGRRAAAARAEELLDLVGIPQPRHRLAQYPHELSGGMRQRVVIAMALACEPKLVIADEPTTALDVTTQAQILELLRSLQARLGVAVIMITHDLGIVAEFADRVQVMFAGRAVEHGPVGALFVASAHPYTRGLLRSIPSFDDAGGRLTGIEGTVSGVSDMPPGCRFAPRCFQAEPACTAAPPPFRLIAAGRNVACLKPLAGSAAEFQP